MPTALLLALAGLASLGVGGHLLRTRLVRRLYGARIESEVRSLFGAAAEVTRVEVDRHWRLVLGARNLAIPGGLALDVSVARLKGFRRGEEVVVESVVGVLSWRGLRAPVSYRVFERPTAPLDGTLVARGASWGAGTPTFDLDGTIRIAKDDYGITATRIACDGASGSGELRGTNGPPRTILRAEAIGAALFTHLVRLVAEPPLAIPKSARVSGTLEIAPDFARALDLTLATEGSRLTLALRAAPDGAFSASRLSGTLAFADALEAGVFTGRVRPRPVGGAELDLELRGTTKAPLLAGKARAARVEVDARKAVLVATDASCSLEVDARGVLWSDLEASFQRGRLQGSGILDANGHASDLRFLEVRVEETPLGLAEPLLRGLASGTLAVRGRGDDTERLEGEGVLELAEPEYIFLRRASGSLRVFGLPELPLRGTQPFRARLKLEKGRIAVSGIDGRVEGLRFEGALDLTWRRALSGRIEAHLDAAYLARSVVLALPAIFTGQVTVPLEISGEVGAPRYSADLVGTLGRLVTSNSVTGALGGIVEGLFGNLLGGERRDAERDKRRKKDGGLDGFLDAFTG